MLCKVKLFARARDLAGAAEVAVSLPDGATVADLKASLARAHPALAGLLGRCAVAVANEFAGDAVAIPLAAEVALLPPVSRG